MPMQFAKYSGAAALRELDCDIRSMEDFASRIFLFEIKLCSLWYCNLHMIRPLQIDLKDEQQSKQCPVEFENIRSSAIRHLFIKSTSPIYDDVASS
jgi:hypothetical protein